MRKIHSQRKKKKKQKSITPNHKIIILITNERLITMYGVTLKEHNIQHFDT